MSWQWTKTQGNQKYIWNLTDYSKTNKNLWTSLYTKNNLNEFRIKYRPTRHTCIRYYRVPEDCIIFTQSLNQTVLIIKISKTQIYRTSSRKTPENHRNSLSPTISTKFTLTQLPKSLFYDAPCMLSGLGLLALG